jgi:hypothetical protein
MVLTSCWCCRADPGEDRGDSGALHEGQGACMGVLPCGGTHGRGVPMVTASYSGGMMPALTFSTVISTRPPSHTYPQPAKPPPFPPPPPPPQLIVFQKEMPACPINYDSLCKFQPPKVSLTSKGSLRL